MSREELAAEWRQRLVESIERKAELAVQIATTTRKPMSVTMIRGLFEEVAAAAEDVVILERGDAA